MSVYISNNLAHNSNLHSHFHSYERMDSSTFIPIGPYMIVIAYYPDSTKLGAYLLNLVVFVESFRVLKVSNSESFRALKLSLIYNFRVKILGPENSQLLRILGP